MNGVERTSVAIVGFGPVGMALAGLLGRRGIDVTVLERADDVFPLPRAAHIDHTGLRVLQEIGCVEQVFAEMDPNSALVLADAELEPLATIPASSRSRSGYPASMYFYQPEFDRNVEAAVRGMPSVDVRRGVEMLSYGQDDDGVTLKCRDVHTGEAVQVQAEWLVGCDGSWSPVREGAGLGLESLGFDEQWLVLDLVLDGDLSHVPAHALQVCDPRRPWVSNPVPGGRYRIEVKIFDTDDVAALSTPEHLRSFIQPLLGSTPFAIERNAVYTFHGLIAQGWRHRRVLIAGDAAHQMPPFLGQGMCSGIRDAANLAWKLAGVVEGRLPSGILDTYESERSPHVKSIIDSAIEIGRFVSVADAGQAAERNRELRAGNLLPPNFQIPPLEPGPLIRSGGGVLFPQPVDRPGGRPTLDDDLGLGIVVLSRAPLEDSDELDWWRQHWGAKIVATPDLGLDAAAVDAWFGKNGYEVAVIRPDRYLLGAGSSLEAIRQDLGEPARVSQDA